MSAKLASATLVFLAAVPLAAQTPAYIVTRLGVDTLAVERYTRTGNKLEGDLVLRHPKDLVRIDLAGRQVNPPVEQFVIGISPQGNGGLLSFTWDDRQYSVPFTVR